MYLLCGKRLFDICCALLALVLLIPLLPLTAILIKVFDRGPVIFRQIRIGRDGSHFIFYKLRSMPLNTGDLPSDKLGSVQITPIGKFIRRTNIDELPQLYNILKGDMSFVGPRPPIPSQIELIEARRNNGSLKYRPGLTGLAQISSYDGMTSKHKAELDSLYSNSITFKGDLKIIIGTLNYLLKPPPVY
jgi:O-antigen biosynthesis protein WbqP